MNILSSLHLKKSIILVIILGLSNTIFAQVLGNASYQQRVTHSSHNINIPIASNTGNTDIILRVKAMSNIKADSYVAVFSLTQVGNTTEEVNRLLEGRIEQVRAILKDSSNSIYTDMISFVPIYEYIVTKRLFSKTYNEIPKGFELKKNLHIRYKDPNQLNDIVKACSSVEIYDLVKVDYFSTKIAQYREELIAKAQILLKEKMARRASLLGLDFNGLDKYVADGFSVVYPVEKYNDYQAFNSSSLYLKKSSKVQSAQKETTFYYQPIIDKEFDFVLNPVIDIPVIQIMYDVNIRIVRKEEERKEVVKEIVKTNTNYVLVTANGEIKRINP